MFFAFFLAKENRGLLLEESISSQQREKILKQVNEIDKVHRIVTMKTMHLSPTTVLVGIEVNLIDGLDTDKTEVVTDKIEQEILKILPESKKRVRLCSNRTVMNNSINSFYIQPTLFSSMNQNTFSKSFEFYLILFLISLNSI